MRRGRGLIAPAAATIALLAMTASSLPAQESSSPPPAERIRIYQLFVRLFGNTNETRMQNGTLAENGVGKFNDIKTRRCNHYASWVSATSG